MRMSCNGCRVLRKGCSENCSIRPCLQWIKSAEAQGNATVFLAKFYGRAGLMNLIGAGPEHLRPAIFRSLLYEACGRIVNPIYGSVGLLWSGSWHLCQAAVEAVLKGAPITPIASDVAVTSDGPPLKAYDIRHVSKGESSAAAADEQHQVKAQRRFKRRADLAKSPKPCTGAADEVVRSPSHESSLSHQSVEFRANVDGDSKDVESMVSEETAEASLLLRAEGESAPERAEERGGAGWNVEAGGEVGLELTLGLETVARVNHTVPVKKRRFDDRGLTDRGACKMELGL